VKHFWLNATLITLCTSPAIAQFQAGAGAIEITPNLCKSATGNSNGDPYDEIRQCYRWVHLAGFSPYVPFRNDARVANGIHDPLWARTLALRDSTGDTLIIVSTDLPGLSHKHINRVRRRVTAIHGIPTSHVIIHSTHTHSAPDASGFWSTLIPDHNRRYAGQIREKIYESIDQAISTLRPATMATVTTTHVSCIDAGTSRLKSASTCHLPDINNQFSTGPTHYDRFLIQRDQRDPIVRNTNIVAAEFVGIDDGQPIATLVNWHNHPDTLGSDNRLISSDYPHYLREYMERTRGGIAIYVVGTLGNQIGGLRSTPVPLWSATGERVYEPGKDGKKRPALVTEGWDKIRSTGYEIASAAAAALDRAPTSQPDNIRILTRQISTPVDNLIHLLATWSVWHQDVDSQDTQRYDWDRCRGILGCVMTEVSLVQLGPLSILTAPGEIDPAYFLGRQASTADYGEWGIWHFPAMEGVDSAMPGIHHAVIGSAQDYLSYMVPLHDNVGWWNFSHPNHYEEWVTIGKRFGDDVAQAWSELIDAARDMAIAER